MKKSQNSLLFGKTNYILMAAGILVIALGFMLMAGGKSSGPNEFSYEIFNRQRIFWAPFLVILGFVVEFAAIFYQSKKKQG